MTDLGIVQDGIRYIPSKVAARAVGLSPDYVSRFCRAGDVRAIRQRHGWYVDEKSLAAFVADQARRREEYNRTLSEAVTQQFQRAKETAAASVTIAPHPDLKKFVADTKRRAARTSRAIATTALVFAVFFSSAFAFEAVAPQAPAISAAFRNNVAGVQTQLATSAASFPWLDHLATNLYNALCPIFTNCQLQLATSKSPLREIPNRAATQATTSASLLTYVRPPVAGEKNIERVPATSTPSIPARSIIIERVVEKETLVASGISEQTLTDRLTALEAKIGTRISAIISPPPFPQQIGGNGNGGGFYSAPPPTAQRIDQLTNTTVNSPAITGGTISNATISGGSVTATDFSGVLAITKGAKPGS